MSPGSWDEEAMEVPPGFGSGPSRAPDAPAPRPSWPPGGAQPGSGDGSTWRQLPPPPQIGERDWELIHANRTRRRQRRHRNQALGITLVALVSAAAIPGLRAAGARMAERLVPAPARATGQPPYSRPTALAALSISDLPVKPTPRPIPAAAKAPPILGLLRQLTLGACCAGAWWSPDGESLLFIDRPPDSAQAAIYRQPLWPPGSLPSVMAEVEGRAADAPRFIARPQGKISVVSDSESGLEWPIDTGGNPVLIAPDGSGLVWFDAAGGRRQVDSLNAFHAAGIDGTEPRGIGGLWGGQILGYLPDSRSVLAVGRPDQEKAVYSLQRIRTADGAPTELARGLWLSDVALSRAGSWVAYLISLDREHPEANGIWVAPTDPAAGKPRKLDFAGAYRWRDDRYLILVPQLPGMPQNALIEFDANLGESRLLYEPEQLSIRIANNDWSIGPDGRFLAFRSAQDMAIWLVDLGP